MGAPAARAAEFSRLWARQGHDVTVLTGFPNHPTGRVHPGYRRRLWRMVSTEAEDGVKIVRSWLLPFPNGKAYERMLNYSSFFVSAASTGLFLERPDVVIASSPQLLVGLAGWWLARCKNVPFVFEVRDLWPESLAAVGAGTEDSMLHRALAAVAGFLYQNSDRIVVVTPAFKDHLIERWQIPRHRITVVEHGVNVDEFSPLQSSFALRKRLDAEGRFVVSYIGTIGMAHGLETLVEAACLLQHSAPHVLFLIVGEGAEKQRIKTLVRDRNLANIRFVDQRPRSEIPGYICASDASLVMLKKADLFRTVLPTKMLEVMACARPVILGVEGYARQIVHEADAGICFEPQNSIALAEAVMRAATAPFVWRETLGRNGRRFVVQNFSRERSAWQYLDLLGELVGEDRSRLAVPA